MALPVEIYANPLTKTSTLDNVKSAIDTLGSQVSFNITRQVSSNNYPASRIDCNDISATGASFETWLNNNGHLAADTHFMLVTDNCPEWGVAAYDVGRPDAYYSPETYGISVLYLYTDIATQKAITIQELCHTIMTKDDGTCPESSTRASEDHSCGAVYWSNYDASPMIASYTGTAASEGWAICAGEPTNHDGGLTLDITECTKRHTEEFVSNYL